MTLGRGWDVLFALLGPLELYDDAGMPVALSGSRLRILLAALLLHANHPVPADTLVEIVWGGGRPSESGPLLRSAVRRLRQTLGPGPAARIAARAPGYLIRLAEDELDVSAFESACAEAGSALRTGAWGQASSAAARALGLWRGTPLLDVPSPMLREQFVPRFEQLRIQVLEDSLEAALRQGHHDDLVPQLRDLTAQHPLRERFHEQLMLALSRAGRQAEALEVYQDARRLLVGELGIEPGPELRRLQQRILAGDPEPTAPAPAGPPAGTGEPQPPRQPQQSVPRQLPAAARYFTGRRAELDLLTGAFAQCEQESAGGGTVVISAIDGMAGIGKTALAVHAAHRLAPRFPDGQLFIDLHGHTLGHEPRTAAEVLEVFLRALGTPPQRIPEDVEQRAALYRERLANTRTLIVLDNAVGEAQVRPLLPGDARCLVLITSRARLKGLYDAQPLALDVLPRPDALALLRTAAGPERVRADETALAEIADLCGRLPLALRIAAALLRHRPAWSLEHLAGLLRDQRRRITALSDGERDLGAVFDLSYAGLADDQRRMFRLLGLIPGSDADEHAAAALAGTDPFTAMRQLEALVDHNLLAQPVPGRYRMHDLIRAYARTLADLNDTAGDRDDALDRLLDYYQCIATHADDVIGRYSVHPDPPGPAPAHVSFQHDPEQAWSWLRRERANLLACLHDAAARADHKRTIALTSALAALLRSDGPWLEAITLYTAASAAAERLGDRRALAATLTELGEFRRLTGDFPGASGDLERALGIFQETGDRPGQAMALTNLGYVWALRGELPSAVRDLEAALAIFRKVGDLPGQATALARLGGVRLLTGDLSGGAADMQNAVDIFRETGDRRAVAGTYTDLGYARAQSGDLSGAAHDLRKALELLHETGERRRQADALTYLGDVLRQSGDLSGARRHLEAALTIFRELGDRNGQAFAMTYLGAALLRAGDLPGARGELERALAIFRDNGARGNESFALNHYAAVIAAEGDPARAETLHGDALRLGLETHQPDEQAFAHEGIGECRLLAGDVASGRAHLQQALDIFEQLTMRHHADRVRTRLSRLA